MKLPKTLFLSLLFITSSYFLFAQQVMVNLEWEAATGNPSELIDYSASTFDDSGNLIVVGNTLTNGESENFLVSKFDPDGALQWEYEYNFNDADSTDFATAVVCDQSNNIYITGGSFDDVSYSFDFATLKLDASGGFKWVERYNGADDLDDIPSAIGVDWNGNVYVSGGSKSQADGWDYMTIKYDDTGSEQWTINYDYGQQLDDFASELHVDGGSGELTVVGGSASSVTAWDFAVIHYDSDGNWLSTDREASGIGTFDKPMASYQDDVGNMYITGSKSANGTDFDIMTVKLNANSQLKWTQTFDGHSMEDGAYDVIADQQGNVYVAGYTQKSNLGMNFLVLKYDSTGTLQWSKERTPYYPQDSAKATEIALDASGNVYASGYIQEQGDKDVLTMRFDPSGQYGWEKMFENPYDPEEFATDIVVDLFGNAYVTAKSIDLATSSYILLHYGSHEREIVLMTDSTNNREIARNELMFRIDPQYLKIDKIDNTDIIFGIVDDFIVSELRNLMADKLGLGTAMGTTPMYKLCPFLTRADTLSVLADGDTIRNPNYYATFVLSLPVPTVEQNEEDFITAKEAVDSLMGLHPKVWVAEVCGTYEPDAGANDFYYNNSGPNGVGQFSLHDLWPYSDPVTKHFSDINIEPAWELVYDTTGALLANPNIRVGIVDFGTLWSHEDFKIDQSITTNSPSNAKIKGGTDFTNGGISIFSQFSQHRSHPTSASGIIGALRNNSTGIAGIAGGNMLKNDTGSDLYDYIVAINNLQDFPFDPFIVRAINEAIHTDDIKVLNFSFSKEFVNVMLWEALENARRHQITLVASRGNEKNSDRRYPACYPGVIGVGATDEWGRRYLYPNDGQNSDSGWGAPNGSSFGPHLDIMAPGVNAMVQSTNAKSSKYSSFLGTSAATAHVSGVAALLLRFHNTQGFPGTSPDELAPEDVQRLMELTAWDINTLDPDQKSSNAWAGYDYYSGYGLLDAGKALSYIKAGDHFISHFETTNLQTQSTGWDTIFLEMNYKNYSFRAYPTEIIKVTATISSINAAPGFHIEKVWARNSASDGWDAPRSFPILRPDPTNINFQSIYPTDSLTIDSITSTQAFVSGYFYRVLNSPTDTVIWPSAFKDNNPIAPKFSISILYCQNGLKIEDEQVLSSQVRIYPNPANEMINIQFQLHQASDVSIQIYSIDGKRVSSKKSGLKNKGLQVESLSIKHFSPGIYLIEIIQNGKSQFLKFIKR